MSAIGFIIPLLLFVIFLALGVVLICLYMTRKRNVFRIDYAGGNIGFDLRFTSLEEAQQFQQTLRVYKDKADYEKYQGINQAGSSVPDELQKYYELLQQGIITQEEFEAKKKMLLTNYSDNK